MTLSQLAEKITLRRNGDARLAWDKQDEWQQKTSSHSLTLRYRGRRMTVDFWSNQIPTAADVLNCLVSDASTYDNSGRFEEWCGDLGLDADSRKAEKTYRAVGRQAASLKKLLGGDYDEFVTAENDV